MEGLKEDVLAILEGGKVQVNVNKFANDLSVIRTKDDALTALIHLGYLAYDSERKAAFIPNFEVALAFEAALSDGKWSEAHDAYTSILKYNDENSR